MTVLTVLAIVVIVAVVALLVSAPIRKGVQDTGDDELAELIAEKESKYREIRDAELDHETGKPDDADWKAIDRQLRAEAVAILRKIDDRGGETTPDPDAPR